MTTPSATYRLQFRGGMDFTRAVELVPYLKGLGISHLYASPVFMAKAGSSHGYDVIDPNRFDPALGGAEGFFRLSAALKAHGMGLVLDIVPNHMAADMANPWWRSVAEFGRESPFAAFFDIDWSEPLTLPFLGQSFEAAVAAGEIGFGLDETAGVLGLRYHEALYPIAPATYSLALAGIKGALAEAVAQAAAGATPVTAEAFHDEMRGLIADVAARETLAGALATRAQRAGRVTDVHALQAYRLGYWRDARRHLSYRRFFEVTGLVGVAVEDARVFEATHKLALELVASGAADGLRIDHIDGLADPGGYLKRLRARIGPDVYLVVEKILGAGEALPANWPIAGTTGYEFIAALGHVFIDEAKAEALDRVYWRAIGEKVELDADRTAAKAEMVRTNFETEFAGLNSRAAALAESELGPDAYDKGTLAEAIAALVEAFPVYRTYGTAAGQSGTDEALIGVVADAVMASRPECDPGAVGFIVKLLNLDVSVDARPAALDFMVRFQQASGPVMAKAVEDTLFYRRNRLLALNEVGGDPQLGGGSLAQFHAAMAARVGDQPEGLLATATHDTKRGEDARARLYTLSEAPEIWAEGVVRWREMQKRHVQALTSGPAPEPETEWMIYQALAGIWPFEAPDRPALSALGERFVPYLEKVLREAKTRTGWLAVEKDYEGAVRAYAEALLAPGNTRFHADFSATLAPFCRAGALNGLAQTAIKLCAPGIPDLYQGSEGEDFSLVDPDNRRPVDFSALAAQLEIFSGQGPEAIARHWRGGAAKQVLLARGLAARTAHPRLFTHGQYRALEVVGTRARNVVAFERRDAGARAVLIAPRLCMAMAPDADRLAIAAAAWGTTRLILPDSEGWRPLVNLVTGEAMAKAGEVTVEETLRRFPVAMLVGVARQA